MLKEAIRRSSLLYELMSWIKGTVQDQRVLREQEYYQRRAEALGLCYSETDTARRLRDKVAGKQIRPKRMGALTIFAAFRHYSWEVQNLLPELAPFGEVIHYDWHQEGFDDHSRDWISHGREAMNQHLLNAVKEVHSWKPIDIFFGYLSHWAVSPQTIEQINGLGIFTFNFCWDDVAGFWGARTNGIWPGPAPLACAFDLNWTNASKSCIKYMVEGGIAVWMPEGANPRYFRPLNVQRDILVSFIGQRYGVRPGYVSYLQRHGIPVKTFGDGWLSGRIASAEMARLYSRSHVNLGFGNVLHSRRLMCLKGRDFEVPMTGGLYLTQYNPELESCYEIGEEIACYSGRDDLLEQVKLLVADKQRAEEIRRAGRERALREHTWAHRFAKIFQMAGVFDE